MTAQVLFFNVFSEKDTHLNAIECEKLFDVINYTNNLPNEIIEKILMDSIKNFDHMYITYSNIINMCTVFQMNGQKEERLSLFI